MSTFSINECSCSQARDNQTFRCNRRNRGSGVGRKSRSPLRLPLPAAHTPRFTHDRFAVHVLARIVESCLSRFTRPGSLAFVRGSRGSCPGSSDLRVRFTRVPVRLFAAVPGSPCPGSRWFSPVPVHAPVPVRVPVPVRLPGSCLSRFALSPLHARPVRGSCPG